MTIHANKFDLKGLTQCLSSTADLENLKTILAKVEKCHLAVQKKGYNLADVLADEKNIQSLISVFGEDHYSVGLQWITRLALENYSTGSITIDQAISGGKKLGFIHKTVAQWSIFDLLFTVYLPDEIGAGSFILINPKKKFHLEALEKIPEQSVVTVYVKNKRDPENKDEEHLGVSKCITVIDTVQSIQDDEVSGEAPKIIEFEPARQKALKSQKNSGKTQKPSQKPASVRSIFKRGANFSQNGMGKPSGPPVASFKVLINKMDTFVHAGNAQLIVTHLREYSGRVIFSVLRDTKKSVQLDADSIWGAEIRNGETVMFEFYGPKPSVEFMKELAKNVNKYTQMDKIA